MLKKIVIIELALVMLSCGNSSHSADNTTDSTLVTSDFVEVLFFRSDQRCSTCRNMERYVKDVVNDNFNEELRKGELVLSVYDVSDEKQRSVIDEYEAVWTSLFVTKHCEGALEKIDLTLFAFSYSDTEPDTFKEGLKKEIMTALGE